jgi:hypothetical protein
MTTVYGQNVIITAQYGWQSWPQLAPFAPEPKVIPHELVAAGVTELHTVDGYRIQLRLTNIRIIDGGHDPDGHPVHQLNFDAIPTVSRLLDGPAFGIAGGKAN